MKIHIEVDLEWCDSDIDVLGYYDGYGNYQYIKAKDVADNIGKVISFDEAYLRKDHDDNNFYLAKLINVIPNQPGDYKRPYPTPAKSVSIEESVKKFKKKFDEMSKVREGMRE